MDRPYDAATHYPRISYSSRSRRPCFGLHALPAFNIPWLPHLHAHSLRLGLRSLTFPWSWSAGSYPVVDCFLSRSYFLLTFLWSFFTPLKTKFWLLLVVRDGWGAGKAWVVSIGGRVRQWKWERQWAGEEGCKSVVGQ